MTVVSFEEEKIKSKPHRRGEAKCLGCGHKWEAISPLGVTGLECPSCTTMKGVFNYLSYPGSGEVFHCNCGNDHFVVGRTKILCVGCGLSTSFSKLW